MIVVSDTTPLNYLVLIDAVDVLAKLFREVYAPHAVLDELTHPKAPEAVRRWAQSPPAWLKVADPAAQLPSTAALDRGEADAISLAKELHITDILIDERRGRKVAEREGLVPLPTLALLERAAKEGFVELPEVLERIQRTSIRLPPEQVRAALERDAQRKRGT